MFEQLHFSIVINTSKQKVWETMLNEETYKQWTAAFNPSESEGGSNSSYVEGSWEQGSDIRFLGSDKDGKISGMISRVKENRPYDFLSIQHLGEIHEGQDKLWPVEVREPEENYTLEEVDGGTKLSIDIEVLPDLKDMFNGMWPKALEKLKELSET